MALPVTDGQEVGLAILKPLGHTFIQKVAVCHVVNSEDYYSFVTNFLFLPLILQGSQPASSGRPGKEL